MKTLVALFDSVETARRAARDLEAGGFRSGDVSVVAPQDTLAAGSHYPPDSSHGSRDGEATGTGAAIGAGFGALAGLAAVTVPGFGVVAALGPIVAGGILGAVAGGLIGSLVDAGVPADDAACYEEGVRRGGTLVGLAVHDADAPGAMEILSRHSPVDLNERSQQWERTGWTRPGAERRVEPAATAGLEPLPPAAIADVPDPTGRTTMGDSAAAEDLVTGA